MQACDASLPDPRVVTEMEESDESPEAGEKLGARALTSALGTPLYQPL